MIDLIDRDELKSRVIRLQERVDQLCSYNDALLYDAARIIDNTLPVTSAV